LRGCAGALRGRDVQVHAGDLGTHRADPELVRELFHCLLDNALRFTRHRSPAVIRVEAVELGHGTGWRVSDNGEGFDMAFAGQLFRVFQTLGRVGGLGIGLATARRIVERHGGRIFAEGSPGVGAAFVFTLGAA
jgi:signal transduction histidine kinase